MDGRTIRKGSVDAIRRYIEANHGHFPAQVDKLVEEVARSGGTPLVVAEEHRVLRGDRPERYRKRQDPRTLCTTASDGDQNRDDHGDNQLTAAAIAAEAGVDDFLAEATRKQNWR